MKPKTYRRLTRLLFFFLFLMFVLLFFLFGGVGRMPQRGEGGGGGILHREMGTIHLSEIRSGGFALEELPVQSPSRPGEDTFNENVMRCDATLYNESTGPIQVAVSVFGTHVLETANIGLSGTYVDYSAQAAPFPDKDYGSWMAARSLQPDEQAKNMALYLPPSATHTLTLEAGETRQLTVLFWVDSDHVEALTNLDRSQYSATVRLISRSL